MDENSEGGRVLAHCESLPGPDPNPRDPSRIPGANPCALGPPSPESKEGKLTFIERLVLLGHFPCLMSCNPPSRPSGRYYCQYHFTPEKAAIQKNQRTCPSHKSREPQGGESKAGLPPGSHSQQVPPSGAGVLLKWRLLLSPLPH